MTNYEAIEKLEIVENYTPRELRAVIMFLESEMFYDKLGRPYTHEYFRDVVNRFGAKND